MKNIHQILLISFCLCFFNSLQLDAQTDPKYLAGAVPEVNGKVVFSDVLSLNNRSAQKIYEMALMWAEANYKTTESRVAYTSKENAVISCRGESELIFSSSALALDKTDMTYTLNIFCLDNACKIEMKSITYQYNVADKRTPEKYYAEKWITDKEAVNGNKLYRMNGKFRIKTIDLFDDICNSLNLNILSGEVDLYTDKDKVKLYDRKNQKEDLKQAVSQMLIKQPQPHEGTGAVTQQTVSGTTTFEGSLSEYKKVDPDKIPGNIIQLLQEDRIIVTAGNDMISVNWGGLGILFGKPVVFCFINPGQSGYPIMETGSSYTLSFYHPVIMPSGAKTFSDAWLIVECKKLAAQPIQTENINDEKAKEDWNKSQPSKMFIGEILNVWMK